MSDVDRPWDKKPAGGASPKATGIGCAALAVFVFVVGLVAVLGGDGEEDETHDEFGAQVVCEDAVEALLKSPSSADFSNPTRTKSGTGWTIAGTVDADNSFGASLRHTYTCEAVPGSVEDEYSVRVTQFDQQ